MIRLEVDGDRLWSTVRASAEIGALPDGGLRRLALSDTDRQMRDLFTHWVEEAGYQLSIDQLGASAPARIVPSPERTMGVSSCCRPQWI
jgi:hypothetical protein